jgi:GGDEF domain-containing protein
VRIGQRLHPVVRPADTLGRWGGDEFVIVCEDLDRASEASAIAQRIATAFEVPFTVLGTKVQVSASIGVAVSGGTDDQPATLIHAADSDMYRTKQDRAGGGGQGTPVFSATVWRPKLGRLTDSPLELLARLEGAGDISGDNEKEGPTGCAVA